MIKLLPVLLLLSGCTTVTVADKMIECANPALFENFVYRGFTEAEVQDDTLILTTAEGVVFYALPDGTACRIKNNNEEMTLERQD